MKALMSFLSSMKLSVGLFIVISAASLAGTLMPQETANRAIYGSLWFIALLAALMVNTLACVMRRKISLKNAGSVLMHLGVPVIMAGAIIGITAGFYGEVTLYEGQSTDKIIGAKKEEALLFTLRLDRFEIEKYPVKARHFITSHGESGGWKRHEFKGAGGTVSVDGIGPEVKIMA
ncbi:MAG TPA: cytochrome c biogenesis protein ResB, partial [Candidatus Goldiibacteriota bacterium]|nr:cytochrome c biogenesis protein ResB [Candidatus Goldiibacteriota bacterium]